MNSIIREHGEIRDQETYAIIEARLGHTLNGFQRTVLDSILDAEPGRFCSFPMPRRSGKTSLANALMRCITDAVCVVERYGMQENYDYEFQGRMYAGNADLSMLSPGLVILDEVVDIEYLQRLRQAMHTTRFLHMYTPREPATGPPRSTERNEWVEGVMPWEGATSAEDGPYRDTPATEQLEEVGREFIRRERLRRTLSMDEQSFLNTMLEKQIKKDKEWDDEENK